MLDKVDNGEMISIDTLDKLLSEKDSVICFMGCAASLEHVINKFKELLK